METFGQLIRRLRSERGETLAQVAERITDGVGTEPAKLSVPMLSRIETDDRFPSTRTAVAIAEYFGVDPEMAIGLLADTQAMDKLSRLPDRSRPSRRESALRSALREEAALISSPQPHEIAESRPDFDIPYTEPRTALRDIPGTAEQKDAAGDTASEAQDSRVLFQEALSTLRVSASQLDRALNDSALSSSDHARMARQVRLVLSDLSAATTDRR